MRQVGHLDWLYMLDSFLALIGVLCESVLKKIPRKVAYSPGMHTYEASYQLCYAVGAYRVRIKIALSSGKNIKIFCRLKKTGNMLSAKIVKKSLK